MSNMHPVTLHHIITVYNNMFDHMDGVTGALSKNITRWQEDLLFAVKLARYKLSKSYAEVTPSMGILIITVHIVGPFRKLQSCRKWDKGMDITPEDETSCTTQYHEAVLKYVESEYFTKHGRVPVNDHESLPRSNLTPSEMVFGSSQSTLDPYKLSSDDEEYLTPNNVAETTSERSGCAAC